MIVKVKREKEVGNLLVVRSKARLVELGLVKVVSEISVLHFGQILIATHCTVLLYLIRYPVGVILSADLGNLDDTPARRDKAWTLFAADSMLLITCTLPVFGDRRSCLR